MRYFYKVTSGVMVLPLMESLARQSELWNTDKTRTEFEGTPHGSVDDVLLRFGSPDGDDLEAVNLPPMVAIRGARDMAHDVMTLVRGSRLGRVVVTRLPPGGKILPHADVVGAYSSYYTRYHVVLQGLPGSMFRCGDETVNMFTGDIYWFDASAEHELYNNSKDDRVHMLVDVRIDP